MRKSIRYYFFGSIAAVLVGSVVVIAIIQSYLAIGYFRNEKETLLQSVADGVVRGTREGQIDITREDIYTIRYMARIANATVFIADTEGRLTFCTDIAQLQGPDVIVSERILTQVGKTGRYNELGHLEGVFTNSQYIAAAPIATADGTVTGYVFAATDASSLLLYLSDLASSFLLSAALVLLVASAVALLLTNHMVVPIQRISQAARQFGEGNYATRVPVEGDNELAQLAITFNEMANSFEATDVSRRSFMGNIAHELRTPMTTIKGFIDGMLDGTIPEDQRDKYLAIVSEEVGRLARLTQNMLDVSRLETGEYTPNASVFNVWQPIVSVLAAAQQRLDEQHIQVENLEAEDALYVLADEDFVHQILFNLIDNAIKFTPENGRISILAKASKTHATITVHNTGAGLAPEVLPHIFDRFYKEDQSRGLNAGGSGLGLHICKVLVGLLGGRIWAESEENAWAAFSFTLPCAPPKKVASLRADAKGKEQAATGKSGKTGGEKQKPPKKGKADAPPKGPAG